MIVFLVEDRSMAVFLTGVLERLSFPKTAYQIKPYNGKEDLTRNLAKVVPSWAKRAKCIVILLDRDHQDCITLKYSVLSKLKGCTCPCFVRLACRELESWFLGDMEAIAKCSTRFNQARYKNKAKFRNVDELPTKPSDELEKLLPDWEERYFGSKPKFAEQMGKVISLEPDLNCSHSFKVFLRTLSSLKNSVVMPGG